MLDGPDGEHVGEIDLDPHETSLLDATGTYVADNAVDSMIVDPSDDSAVGSDERAGDDSSFQTNDSGDAPAGDVHEVSASTSTGEEVSVQPSDTTSASVPDIHECVSIISDAVHVQTASTIGVVDTRLVSTLTFCHIV